MYIDIYIYIIYIIFHTLNPCVLFVSRWMNGPFEELDGMSLETNLDDFFRDIFKMLKFFQQKQNRDEKDAEKVFRKTGDDEPKKQESPSVVLCSAVMEQIKEFKVKRVIIMMRKHQTSSSCDTEWIMCVCVHRTVSLWCPSCVTQASELDTGTRCQRSWAMTSLQIPVPHFAKFSN